MAIQAASSPTGATVRVVADADSAAAADLSLAGSVPIPPSTRRRYDPLDLVVEEVWVSDDALVAYQSFSSTLTAAGWHPDEDRRYGDLRMGRFVKETERVLLAAWNDLEGIGSEVAIGPAGCLPPPELPATRSVYLDNVPGPPGAQLVGYQRTDGDSLSVESWRQGCIDLDLFGALMVAAAGQGWAAQKEPRIPGGLTLSLVPSVGPTVTVSARPIAGGQTAVDLSRHEGGRATTKGSSLLSPDVPLPMVADARSMTVDAPGWSHREEYDVPAFSAVAAAIWLREHLPTQGWDFERTEPETDGTGLVFFSGGEELLIELSEGAIALQRRRACPDGLGRIPAGDAVESRWLLEVPVVPGAAYDGWDGVLERYRLTCADLGLLVDWYRVQMEEGNWALAGTGIPSATARDLLFVRPAELGTPHEMRSAWANIVLRRAWPYHYEITLSRDPGGIRTP